jgi:hypothetical protein
MLSIMLDKILGLLERNYVVNVIMYSFHIIFFSRERTSPFRLWDFISVIFANVVSLEKFWTKCLLGPNFCVYWALGHQDSRNCVMFFCVVFFWTYQIYSLKDHSTRLQSLEEHEPKCTQKILKTTIGVKQRSFVRQQPGLELAAIVIFEGLLCAPYQLMLRGWLFQWSFWHMHLRLVSVEL